LDSVLIDRANNLAFFNDVVGFDGEGAELSGAFELEGNDVAGVDQDSFALYCKGIRPTRLLPVTATILSAVKGNKLLGLITFISWSKDSGEESLSTDSSRNILRLNFSIISFSYFCLLSIKICMVFRYSFS
jgi:hypothetical protein